MQPPNLDSTISEIPPGPFLMGSDPRQDSAASVWETPQHRLHLPGYAISRTPTTNAQYAAFVRATGYRPPAHWTQGAPPPGKSDHPVVHVTFYDALAYCRWLSESTGKHYRLPSEAEWEKAARGDDGRLYPWGSHWEPDRCNTKELGLGDTTPVSAYPQGASPYGLLDVAGNVYEWTASLWGKDMKEPAYTYPYEPSGGRENPEADQGIMRVLRGGAFFYNALHARAAHRVKSYPDYAVRTRGFRVCLCSET